MNSSDIGDNNGRDDARIGLTVGGRYVVESIIGEGGFGRVYRARHVTLGEVVAIKFLHRTWSEQSVTRARFKREAVALARLRHPSIVSVHDYGEIDGDLYIVMEYLVGESLATYCSPPHLLPIPRALEVIDDVLQVVEAAHGSGIVHRDLKPDNVLLIDAGDRLERVKVLDFGLALVDDQELSTRLTATQVAQGTPIYMSPEQCRGRDVGPPTDIYAAGVMLFQLIAGEPPFAGETSQDVIVKHMYVDSPPVGETGARREVGPALEDLIKRVLAKTASERPTAAEFRDYLDGIRRGTDAVTRAVHDSRRRIVEGQLTRHERALGHAPTPAAEKRGTTPAAQPGEPAEPDRASRALVWGLTDERLVQVRSVLAVNGIASTACKGDALPPNALVEDIRVIVIRADASAEHRLQSARAVAPRVPIVVIDVPRVEDTVALIRAGASDVGYASTPDEAFAKQVMRVIRRGR